MIVGLDLRAGPRLVRELREPAVAPGCRPASGWPGSFLVAVVAVEFSIVFWGATLIQRQTGVPTEAATVLAALFLGGMFVGRLGQSAGLGTTGDIRRWAALGDRRRPGPGAGDRGQVCTSAPVSGAPPCSSPCLGAAGLYPLGVAAALGRRARAPDAGRDAADAGDRARRSSWPPSLLGVAADAAGVPVAWGLVVVVSLVALGLVAVLPAGIPEDAADEAAAVAPSIG